MFSCIKFHQTTARQYEETDFGLRISQLSLAQLLLSLSLKIIHSCVESSWLRWVFALRKWPFSAVSGERRPRAPFAGAGFAAAASVAAERPALGARGFSSRRAWPRGCGPWVPEQGLSTCGARA